MAKYQDSKYAQTDYSQSLYRGDDYLDPMYLELAYLDPNILVEQTSENKFQLTDMTTGVSQEIEREQGGGLRTSSHDDKSAFASPTDRSIDNDFGYNEFSLGKIGDTAMGVLGRTGVLSPTGIMGATHSAVNNVNKNKAVEQARQHLSLSPVERGMFSLGNLADPKGAVANMQIGEETYSVAIGGVKKDALGRDTISVQEAMDLAQAAKEQGLTVRELSTEESKIRDKMDQKKGLAKDSKTQGILGRATEVAKDALVGAVTGNPTKGISSAINQTAQAIGSAVAPSVKDIAKSVVGNPSANTQSTVAGAYGTSPMSQAAQERAQQKAARSVSPQTAQDKSLAPNALGVESPSGFTSPMGALGSRTTSSFGQRNAPSTGKGTVGSTNHKGIDLSTPAREAFADTTQKSYAGAPLQTPGAGTVTAAGYQKGYGYAVDISHPGGWTSKIAHMAPDSITVSVGDQIAANTPVGQMGTTGNSQAAHAHFEMRDPLGNLVDPATVIDFDTQPSVATPETKPSFAELNSQVSHNPATSPQSLQDQSLGMSFGMTNEETLGGVVASNPDTVQTSPNAYSMMNNLDNLTAPSSVAASMQNLDPTAAMKSFSPAFADVVSPSSVQTTSVSPTSMNTMQALGTPDAPSVSPGRNAHNSYSAKDLSRMGYTMAGELSPGALKGLQAQDPAAIKEALGMFSTIDNRIQSYVERGVPLNQAIDATLTGSQYNSLMSKNTNTTAANYSQFGNVLGGLLSDVNVGKTSIPSELANVTHYANLGIVDPSWAKTPEAIASQVQVGAHTFSTPDRSFAHSAMKSTPSDETTQAVGTSSLSETAKDTAKGLGMNDSTPGSAGLGATSRDSALSAATQDARDTYGATARGLGGLGQNVDSRMGTQDTGTASNALGGGLGFGGGYVGADTLSGPSDVSPSKDNSVESGPGFGGVSGSGSTSRGGQETGSNDSSSGAGNSGSGSGSGDRSGNSSNTGSSGSKGSSKSDKDNDSRGL